MKEGFRSEKLVTVKKVQSGLKNPRQNEKWLCKCDCGNERIINASSLHCGEAKSCGCREYKNKKKYGLPNYLEIIKKTLESRTKKNEQGCWIWQGSKHRQGYGHLVFNRKVELTHRVSWVLYYGEIPKGIKVCHKCDVPSCCNPEHLFLGTQNENVQDMMNKGRKITNVPATRRIKLTWNQVQDIKKIHAEGMTRKELQEKYSVSACCIFKILNGISWKKNWETEI